MIADSLLVCYFPRRAFTTLNIKAAEQFLWFFLKDLRPTGITKHERWLEIQCGTLINQEKIPGLNTELQIAVRNASTDYDCLAQCVIYLRVMFEMGRIAESLKTMSTQHDSQLIRMINLELLQSVRAFAGHTLPTNLQLLEDSKNTTTSANPLLSHPMFPPSNTQNINTNISTLPPYIFEQMVQLLSLCANFFFFVPRTDVYFFFLQREFVL
ncbi:hypothetical protein RFI_25975 [Reticulomyxa filosa]|uniref:Uncharacterized protein n=1 Tax=Reticulomyxa filosa TaxID=46433 RepID=X6MEF0_RETFI|nr:hypothetical protein RFI_25975 [Reticulomyxa filosa]|eukprot:ETO11400.1 hypothetical protein RFI_25975 [Reticulomyxa filosa]